MLSNLKLIGQTHWGKVILSVLAGALGVQSEKNREEDFSGNHSVIPYIFGGLIFVLVFMLAVYLFVQILLQ